jgi:hypothetical protein
MRRRIEGGNVAWKWLDRREIALLGSSVSMWSALAAGSASWNGSTRYWTLLRSGRGGSGTTELGREPTAQEIAVLTGVQPEEVRSLKQVARGPISLEKRSVTRTNPNSGSSSPMTRPSLRTTSVVRMRPQTHPSWD